MFMLKLLADYFELFCIFFYTSCTVFLYKKTPPERERLCHAEMRILGHTADLRRRVYFLNF